jgi:hypothetical protein
LTAAVTHSLASGPSAKMSLVNAALFYNLIG